MKKAIGSMFLKCVLWIQSILLLTSSTETHEFLLLNQVILSTEKKKRKVHFLLKQIKGSMQLNAKLSRVNFKPYLILEERVIRPK